jgi:hypothetical protein
MNELNRMRYLDALGIDHYVSRVQLPGAAPTRRLAVVRKDFSGQAAVESPTGAPASRATPARPSVVPDIPSLDEKPARELKPPAAAVEAARPQAEAVRFSLAAIFVGQIAWVEALNGNPLAKEQVQLVHAMARAVSGDVGRPDVTQFDWPTHQNHQLDLGPEAAQAGVAGFLQRQIEQRKCRALVLLGKACESRVPLAALDEVNAVVTESTVAMLGEPLRKRQVWQDLQPLVLRV